MTKNPQDLFNQLVTLITEQVETKIIGRITNGKNTAGRKGKRSRLCLVTGCKNVGAPRYGMFCAAKHKDLPAREKDKYRKKAKE